MPVEDEILSQIGLPESNRLKYEPLLPSSSELGRLICAFANNAGGILILGLLNKNNKVSAEGLSADFQVNLVLNNSLAKINPTPLLQSGFVKYEEKQLFYIKVEKAVAITAYDQIQYSINKKIVYKLNATEESNNDGFEKLKASKSSRYSSKSIFISYNWAHKTSAIKLYNFLKEKNYAPTIDDHNLGYKDSISSFMESIRASDFAVLIISDEYLKSENCMIEALHVLKDRNSNDKILPIRHENVQIFKSLDRIKYIEFWQSQVHEREAMPKNIDPTMAIEEIKRLKNAKRIHQDIGDFLSHIADLITNTIEKEEKVLYKNILAKIDLL